MSKKILNKRSNQVVNGRAKLPTTSEIDYGEIAINYHDGVESIAIKNDSGEVVTFATEENLNKTELKTDQKFSYRKTNVNWDAKAAAIKSVKGNTLAWNNLYDKSKAYSTQTFYGVTATTNIDGSITFSGTCTQSESFALTAMDNDHKMIVGHKYYLRGATATTPRLRLSDQTTIYDEGSGAIWTCNLANVGVQLACNIQPNRTYSGTIKVKIVDLTLMFGPGKEPSAVAEFDALFKEPSYTFTPGTLISNDAKGIETVGFNIWDEEWELGSWTTSGSKYTRSDAIRCKDLIPILPNTDYYYKSPTASGGIGYFDINKSFLGSEYYVLSPFNRVHRSPENAYFVVFYTLETSYNNNICINISDPNRNGQYEPYTKSYLPLNLSSLKVKSPNIWDEEWENGLINSQTGSLDTSSANSRTKNYISVVGGQTYYFKAPYSLYTRLYNAKKEYLGQGRTVANTTYQIPEGVSYIKFVTDYASITIGDICINLSNIGFNGKYFPYGELTVEGGLKNSRTCVDEITGSKYIKKTHKVVFNGTESYWGYASGVFKTGADIFNNNPLPNFSAYRGSGSSYRGNGITSHFGLSTPGTGIAASKTWDITDNVWGITFATNIVDSLSASTSADDWKSWLAGQYTAGYPLQLVYEMEYPEVYELVEPLPSLYMVGMCGTERAVNPVHEDGSPSAPFNGDIQYGVSHGDIAGDTSVLAEKVSNIADDTSKLAEKVSDIDEQLDGVETLLSLI